MTDHERQVAIERIISNHMHPMKQVWTPTHWEVSGKLDASAVPMVAREIAEAIRDGRLT